VKETEDLEAELNRLGVPSSAYGLEHDKNEAFCIVQQASEWVVFYSERGNQVSRRVHATFQEAAKDFLSRLFRDGSVRRMMHEEHWRLGPDGRLYLAPPTATDGEKLDPKWGVNPRLVDP
jgi:hypothetical protein